MGGPRAGGPTGLPPDPQTRLRLRRRVRCRPLRHTYGRSSRYRPVEWRHGRRQQVDSIETLASGYTPMFFASEDPEMTVIWVFSEEVEGGIRGEGPGAD